MARLSKNKEETILSTVASPVAPPPTEPVTVTPAGSQSSNNPQSTPVTPQMIDPPSYGKMVNIAEETDTELISKLQPIANSNDAILIAFIAPSMGKKISPVDFQSASIGLWDELGIEETIRLIKGKVTLANKKLFILIESPGGAVDSSYKIAYKLRSEFSQIISFVPHMAASGGTLITISANEVIIGDMGNLTPIDVQVPYGDSRVSVNRMSSALATLVEFFETKMPYQVPYPYKAMVDKLDPIIYADWNSKTNAMIEYSIELLSKAGYQSPEMIKIIKNLILTNQPHNFVIHKDRAKEFGINVVDNKYENELNCMRWWLNHYMLIQGYDHSIRYVIPNTQQATVTT